MDTFARPPYATHPTARALFALGPAALSARLATTSAALAALAAALAAA